MRNWEVKRFLIAKRLISMIVNKLQVYKIFPKIGRLGQIILTVNQGLHAELIGHYVILNQFLSIAICFSSGALYK